ncbi:MAG: EAL domain-containing protein [Spirochaetaceae bacterium]|nr:EAL domain-containing protein [Spirochaetaceae bacterium]
MTKKNNNFIIQFLLIAIPLLILWTSLLIDHNNEQEKTFKAKVISENVINNKNTAILVSNYISNLINSSNLFSNSNLIQLYLDETNSTEKQQLRNKFIETVKLDSEISKMDFYDFQEEKQLSVEITSDDSIISYEKKIDNTSQNFYPNNKVMVSSLSIANDFSLSKSNASLKLLVPILDKKGILRGQLVILYKADHLMKMMTHYSTIIEKNVSLFVLNKNKAGNYIISSSSTNTSDFASINRIDFNNLLLEKSITSEYGNINLANNLFTYFNILSKVDKNNILNNEKWVVVNHFDINQKFSIGYFLKDTLTSYYGFIFVIIILFSLVATYFIIKLRSNKAEINLARMVAETTADSVVILDSELNITYVNKSFEKLLGFTINEILGKPFKSINVDINNPLMIKENWKTIVKNRNWHGNIWQQKRNGLLFPIKISIFATKNNNIEQQFIGMISEITVNEANITNYENYFTNNSQIVYDLFFKNIIKGHKYVLIYINVENHRELGEIFAKAHLDIIDTIFSLIVPNIGLTHIVAKTGTNIINILVNIDNIEDSPYIYLKKLHDLLSKNFKIGKQDVFFKINIGAALYPNDTLDIKQLFINSAIACDWNNVIGHVDYSLYNFKMKEDINRKKLIVKNLRYALENNEFFMNYQPQVDIQEGKVVGMEALIRWTNKEIGSISPAEFIPIAEKNQMMINLGKWIIEKVCSDLKYIFSRIKINDYPLKCAINVSALQFEDEEFLKHLYMSIEANGLSYKNIEIEITENSFLDQLNRTKPILDDISSRGITIAIDDFGTGYSSLSYLNRIPVDKIKIDRGFIKDFPDGDSGELVEFLVKMSKTLRKEVLTEGAETEDQVRYLKDIGCQFIQGYYYSKPLSIEAFINYINNFNFKDL